SAVDLRTAQKLCSAFPQYEADLLQRVCVFHSANSIFCAGAGLQEVANGVL
ncbi:hypothetical protein K469DRAFT_608835, partial [Zopfia rhizophila CBS 207.26]